MNIYCTSNMITMFVKLAIAIVLTFDVLGPIAAYSLSSVETILLSIGSEYPSDSIVQTNINAINAACY